MTAGVNIVKIIVTSRAVRPRSAVIVDRRAVRPRSAVIVDRRFGAGIGGHLQCQKIFGKLSANSLQYVWSRGDSLCLSRPRISFSGRNVCPQ